ncbi:hypothetical protein [Actinomadura miaoliensis]|uniref:DUF4262 domain-containing protein n=1 Tax=Actinomadura miaoliensis TaxID=430685 RepID=A0ABP7VPV1_9ACTN
MTSVHRTGIGKLICERGPGAVRLWGVERPADSSLYGMPVQATIVLEGSEELDQADLPLVAEVLGDVDRYLEAGLRFMHGTLVGDPAFFGLAEADIDPYRELRATDLPVDSPQLNFYVDEWHIRFAEGRFPICHPYGIAVAFEQRTPIRVDDLSDAEAFEME